MEELALLRNAVSSAVTDKAVGGRPKDAVWVRWQRMLLL